VVNNIEKCVFKNHVVISGPERSGKTSLAMELAPDRFVVRSEISLRALFGFDFLSVRTVECVIVDGLSDLDWLKSLLGNSDRIILNVKGVGRVTVPMPLFIFTTNLDVPDHENYTVVKLSRQF